MTADRITIERELELIDGMIEVQLHHARQCDGIANRAMAEKQKGWDLERVALLRKLRAALAAQPADAQQEPVAEVHAAHLRPYDGSGGHWCREVLLYSGNNPHDWLDGKNTRVKLYATPPPAAVPLTDDQLRADLISCRGTVKTELNHYERLVEVHRGRPTAAAYEAEASRLDALLERIDALIAVDKTKEQTP